MADVAKIDPRSFFRRESFLLVLMSAPSLLRDTGVSLLTRMNSRVADINNDDAAGFSEPLGLRLWLFDFGYRRRLILNSAVL